MSDPAHPPSGRDVDALSVLAVVQGLAELMLAPLEPDRDDHDIADMLSTGLGRIAPTARALRIRFKPADGGGHQPHAEEDVRRLQSLREPADVIRQVLSATEPLTRRGAGGEAEAVMAPLIWRNGTIDLFVLRSDADRLSQTDTAVFSTLRTLAVAAVAVRQAQTEARLDALTGCLNHGAMHAQLDREIARAARASSPLACVMLDLDDFKAVNDRYGHPVGDRILRAIAAALQKQCRPYDSCCRYGGDEFLVILPDTDLAEATHAAQRIGAAIARAAITLDGEEIAVTATTGVADWHAGESASDLITRADRRLLASKVGKSGPDAP